MAVALFANRSYDHHLVAQFLCRFIQTGRAIERILELSHPSLQGERSALPHEAFDDNRKPLFHIESRADATVVHARCDVDYCVQADFLEVLVLASRSAGSRLVVSLEECPYMDCAGLSALIRVRNTARVPISIVVRTDSFLSKVFAITGLAERLGVTERLGTELPAGT